MKNTLQESAQSLLEWRLSAKQDIAVKLAQHLKTLTVTADRGPDLILRTLALTSREFKQQVFELLPSETRSVMTSITETLSRGFKAGFPEPFEEATGLSLATYNLGLEEDAGLELDDLDSLCSIIFPCAEVECLVPLSLALDFKLTLLEEQAYTVMKHAPHNQLPNLDPTSEFVIRNKLWYIAHWVEIIGPIYPELKNNDI